MDDPTTPPSINGSRSSPQNQDGREIRTTTSTRDGSRVVRVMESDGTTRRVAKLIGLQGMSSSVVDPITGDVERVIDKTFFHNAVASFLASKHFNERRGDILPHLPALLQGCDFYWNYEYRDGQWSALQATRELLESINSAFRHRPARTNGTAPTEGEEEILLTGLSEGKNSQTNNIKQYTTTLEPFAAYGAYWSRVSGILSAVTAGLDIPYVTGGSTSAELNSAPLFARTVPTNDLDAHAAILYYQSIGVKHVACLFIKDSWGINYHASLSKYGRQFGVSVASFPYDVDSIERTIVNLHASGYRYVYAIMHNWKHVMKIAVQQGIAGRPEYVWIAAEEKKWTGHDFQVNRKTEGDLAQALHGAGTINIHFPHNHGFEVAMQEMTFNKDLQQEFIDAQVLPEIFNDYDFPQYDPTGFANAIFDAVIALGVTACNTSNPSLPDLFTGTEFYNALLHTEFDGISGHVGFDPRTGTRMPDGVQYSVECLQLSDDRSDEETYRFQSHLVSTVNYDYLTSYGPFVYHDNTTTQPPALPLIANQNLNLLPLWAQICGYVFAGIVILLSVVCCIWTSRNRSAFVVRASQPFFLCQLCVGIFVMALAIIPASFPGASALHTTDQNQLRHEEEDTLTMDVACMSALWLLFIGFSLLFSALTSKTWRLNQLIAQGFGFRHTQVHIQHAMTPLYVGLCIHVILLLCITIISPLEYQRIQIDNFDRFGRSVESYGTCRPTDSRFNYFLGILLVTDFIGVLVVTHEAYKSRDVPIDFSDANSLALCMMSILETLLVGGPVLLVVQDDPTVVFLVGSALLSVCSLAILLLLYIPKYKGRNRRHRILSVVRALRRRRSYFSAAGAGSGSMNECWSGRRSHSSSGAIGSGSNNSLAGKRSVNSDTGKRRSVSSDSGKMAFVRKGGEAATSIR